MYHERGAAEKPAFGMMRRRFAGPSRPRRRTPRARMHPAVVLLLGVATNRWLDTLVAERNWRDTHGGPHGKAARIIQRRHYQRVMRQRLEQLHRSMLTLRANLLKFALKMRAAMRFRRIPHRWLSS